MRPARVENAISAEWQNFSTRRTPNFRKDTRIGSSKRGACFFGRRGRVTDEGYVQALFTARASAPAAIEAARAVGAYSCIDNHVAEQPDVTSAYTQASLTGAGTWVSLPPERWPESWKGRYKAPVVKLVLNIYGHPEAGKLGRTLLRSTQ